MALTQCWMRHLRTGKFVLFQLAIFSLVHLSTSASTVREIDPRSLRSDHPTNQEQQVVDLENLPDSTIFPPDIWTSYTNLSRPLHCEFNALHPCGFTVFRHWGFKRSLKEFAQLMRRAAEAAANAASTGTSSKKHIRGEKDVEVVSERGYNNFPITVPEVNYYPCSSSSGPNRPPTMNSSFANNDDDYRSVLAVHIPWPKFFPLPVPIVSANSTSPSHHPRMDTESRSASSTPPVACLHVDILFMNDSNSGNVNISFSSARQLLQVQLRPFADHTSRSVRTIWDWSSFVSSAEPAYLVSKSYRLPVNTWLQLHIPVVPELSSFHPASMNSSSSSKSDVFREPFTNHGQTWFVFTHTRSMFQLIGSDVCIDNIRLRPMNPPKAYVSAPSCLRSVTWSDPSGASHQVFLNRDGSLRIPSETVLNQGWEEGNLTVQSASSWLPLLFSSVHNSSAFAFFEAFYELRLFRIRIGPFLLAVLITVLFLIFTLVICFFCAILTRSPQHSSSHNNPRSNVTGSSQRHFVGDQDELFRQSLLSESVNPALKRSSSDLNETLERQIPTPSAPPAEDTSTNHSFCFDDSSQNDPATEVTNTDIASIQLARNLRYFQKNRAGRRGNKFQSSSSGADPSVNHLSSFVNPLAVPLTQHNSSRSTGLGDKVVVPPNWRCSRILSLNNDNELVILPVGNNSSVYNDSDVGNSSNPGTENTSQQSTIGDSRIMSTAASNRPSNPESVRLEMAASITALLEAAATTQDRATAMPSGRVDAYNIVDRFQLEDAEGPPSYRDSVCASSPAFNNL